MKKFQLLAATAILITPAAGWAQTNSSSGTGAVATTATGQVQTDTDQTSGPTSRAQNQGTGMGDDIVVTAQRTSERLQDVPISVSAFTGAALETRQIRNSLDLQLSLPNVTFTKTGFTGSSFTIRGIGDLCVGTSCDAATGIHINDVPVPATRLFENEYFDLERVEVLRGPQGTLFGRNATSGVVNFITARPDLSGFHASGYAEYGNFQSIKAQGMINLPFTDTLGVRIAGIYVNRDGYTKNIFDNSRIDGRDLYQVRGSLRWQPSSSTTIDLLGAYFHEKDDRSRVQKQLCHRDPTGVLGCQPDRLTNEVVNGHATFADILTSREFFSVAASPALAPFGLRSLYGPSDLQNAVNPADLRTISTNFNPQYFTDEINVQGRWDQEVGDKLSFSVIGAYNRSRISSRVNYFETTPDSLAGNVGLATFLAASSAPGSPLAAARAAIFDGAGNLCASDVNRNYTGVFGGDRLTCGAIPTNFDQSSGETQGYSAEFHAGTKFDGPINFLVGAIKLHGITNGDYFVSQSEGNYGAAVLGYARSLTPGAGIAPGSTFLASPFFNSETQRYVLDSYGIFGETYIQFAEKLKLTLGARYSNDKKFIRDRGLLYNFLVPYGVTNAFASPYVGTYDADASRAGNQVYREARVQFGRVTGRAVLDFKPSDNSLLYLSYSRGYKSGGINPPFDPAVYTAPTTFRPESVDALELGSKNTFMGGMLQLNGSVFYYKYKDLQLSRIINKTSFNDNTNADIYGAELEATVRPDRHFLVNLSASYLKTKIKNFSLVDTRDPSGGRSDTVIIKDITSASNCVVQPTTAGNAVGANTLVAAFNGAIGLRGPTPVPGTNTTGAFSICSALASTIQNPSAPLRALFGTPTGPLPFLFTTNAATGAALGLPDGVPVNLSGNQLPQAPQLKFSAGAQHTLEFDNGMSFVSRADLTYTGEYFSRSFNRPIDRVKGYEVVNATVQLNGAEDRWYIRGFVTNLTDNNAITGQGVSDPSTGLFTNVFTLEPRRYGVGAGFKF